MRKDISKEELDSQFNGFLNTPPLWKDKGLIEIPPYKFNFSASPKRYIRPDIPSNLVLGKRIEYFFSHYIEHYTPEGILANNVQIINDKTTVGELDFLIKHTESQEVFHIELVYKFYLYDPSFASEKERWIGPNRRDSLVKKLHRLKNHQFPLLYRIETQPLLEDLGLDINEIHQRLCFKANLFVPFPLLGHALPLINNECVKGFWIQTADFTETAFGRSFFYTPQKADWPREPKSNNIWFSFSQISEVLQPLLEQKRSPLIWMKTGKEEYARFFLVWW